jgi:hypothetical protein
MKAVVMAPGEGRFIAVGSAATGVTVKASGADTDDLCTVWEGRVPPGTVGAGPHYHRATNSSTFSKVRWSCASATRDTRLEPAPSPLSHVKRSTAFTTRAVRARPS